MILTPRAAAPLDGTILWSGHLTFGAISVTRLVSTDANTPYRGGYTPQRQDEILGGLTGRQKPK